MKCTLNLSLNGVQRFTKIKLTLSALWRVALAMFSLSWLKVFCITSNHLKKLGGEKKKKKTTKPLAFNKDTVISNFASNL